MRGVIQFHKILRERFTKVTTDRELRVTMLQLGRELILSDVNYCVFSSQLLNTASTHMIFSQFSAYSAKRSGDILHRCRRPCSIAIGMHDEIFHFEIFKKNYFSL